MADKEDVPHQERVEPAAMEKKNRRPSAAYGQVPLAGSCLFRRRGCGAIHH